MRRARTRFHSASTMVLCSLSLFDNFMVTWAFFVASTLFLVLGMSGVVFVKYFVNPSYATWSTKTNPQYPSAEMVREEASLPLRWAASPKRWKRRV